MTVLLSPLQNSYPWTSFPLISSAPMRLIAGPALAIAVSRAGGLGFIGAGSDVSNLANTLLETDAILSKSPIPNTPSGILPIGIGLLNWGASLRDTVSILSSSSAKPAAVWFFAPRENADLENWTKEIRAATQNKTEVWIQVGTVASALEVTKSCKPEVLVVQGSDAGGHGLTHSSSIISLLPEVVDALIAAGISVPVIAAGGIMDGRGVAASLMLGSSGVCMGTRFLASHEAEISRGYQQAVLDASDGGISTVRTSVYDVMRGTTSWPKIYNGRAAINMTFRDWEDGMDDVKNKQLYEQALELGDQSWGKEAGRATTYAGTGVGLVTEVLSAEQIVREVLEATKKLLGRGGIHQEL